MKKSCSELHFPTENMKNWERMCLEKELEDNGGHVCHKQIKGRKIYTCL